MKNHIRFLSLLIIFLSTMTNIFSQDTILPSGTIIFNDINDGQEIVSLHISSGEKLNLTQNPAIDIGNDVFFDGTILFSSSPNSDTDFELFTMDLNGENLIQLTDNTARDGQGRFSPDKAVIAFISDRDGQSDLYLMDLSGENVTRLTKSEIREIVPMWSPNGTHIAFLEFVETTQNEDRLFSQLEVNVAIVSISDSTTNTIAENIKIRNALTSVNTYSYLAWSPDGNILLYRGSLADEDSELFAYNLTTEEITQLTDNEAEETSFVWTDEGQIVYSSFGGFRLYDMGEDTNTYLYMMDADGSNVREITGQSNIVSPIHNIVFISETQQIMFDLWTLGSDGNRIDLWVIGLDGENMVNITNTSDISEGAYFYIPSIE